MNATSRQLRGFVYIVLSAVTIFAIQRIGPPIHRGAIPPHNETKADEIIVELAGETPFRGIYFLPTGATLEDLSIAADIRHISNRGTLQNPLEKAMIYHYEDGLLEKKEPIRPTKRLLLGLTLDINQATRDDLMLIPQIGDKTAQQIIRLRQERGGLKKLEELKEIKGIKDKRFNNLKRYFHVDQLSSSSVGPGQYIPLLVVGMV